MPLQKNQVLTLTIERLSNDGSGVAHSPDGEAVFIPGTAPGGRCRHPHRQRLRPLRFRYSRMPFRLPRLTVSR